MTSWGTEQFWKLYRDLPPRIRQAARETYQKFRANPAHPSLHLERLRGSSRAWSIRVTLDYRAVALRQGDDWKWVWIGSHDEFDREFPC